jgi:hypothetical protein
MSCEPTPGSYNGHRPHQSRQQRQFQLDGLADRYRLTACDNRGMGRTPLPAGPFSAATMADDAAALLRALDVPAAHVAGTPGSSAAWSCSAAWAAVRFTGRDFSGGTKRRLLPQRVTAVRCCPGSCHMRWSWRTWSGVRGRCQNIHVSGPRLSSRAKSGGGTVTTGQ